MATEQRQPSSGERSPGRARMLEASLAITFTIHAAAMIGMVICLLPAVPGGTNANVADRAAYIAHHPWLWRIGWFGWQATAASDLFLSVALVITRWIPKPPAIFALIVTLLALVPDQFSQCLWSMDGPRWAAETLATGNLARYEETEGRLFQTVGGYAAGLYLIAALGWTVALRNAGIWSKWLARASVAAWSFFAFAVVLVCLPRAMWTSLTLGIAGALNAIAFICLLAWIAAAWVLVRTIGRPPG